MDYHPAADIFPLDEEHIPDLAKDIKKNGLLCPIEVLDDKIIDGRRRFLACKKAKVEPQFVNVKSLVEDPIAYVLSLNLERRHLTVSQRARIGHRVRKMYEEMAKDRMREGGGDKKSEQAKKSGKKHSTSPIAGQARDHAGASVGVSGWSVDEARRVAEKGIPELDAAVEAGQLSVSKAGTIAKLPREEQPEALQQALQPRAPSPRNAGRNNTAPQEDNEPVSGKRQGVGVIRANEAINCLVRIPKNDRLRKRGFQIVTDWIKANK